MTKHYNVYILAKARNSTFYVGVTNDLIRRVYEHKNDLADGFTKKYGIKMLVYYEMCDDVNAAIWREKLIKKWRREIKMEAIERMNPQWKDLYYDLTGEPDPVIRRDDKLAGDLL
jgi:putative endonuclease